MPFAPEDPRAIIEAYNATINAHDVAGGRNCYASDARLVTAAGRTVDVDGMCRILSATLAAFPDLRMSVQRWITDGNTVVTEELMEGTHHGAFAGLAATHRPVKLHMLHLNRVAHGKIVERVAYHDTAGIVRQLSEP